MNRPVWGYPQDMTVTASKILLVIAAICGLLVAFGVSFGDLGGLELAGASLFFGWLGLVVP